MNEHVASTRRVQSLLDSLSKVYPPGQNERKRQLLEEVRTEALLCLPRLAQLLDTVDDPELKTFLQKVLDDYMLNVCRLDRYR